MPATPRPWSRLRTPCLRPSGRPTAIFPPCLRRKTNAQFVLKMPDDERLICCVINEKLKIWCSPKSDRITAKETSGQRIVTKGRIAALSSLVAANGFVRLDYSNTWFLWPKQISHSNGISIGLAVFAWLTNVTKRQTDTQTDRDTQTDYASVYSNRQLSLVIAALRRKI